MDVHVTRRALLGTFAAVAVKAENGRYADCKTTLGVFHRPHGNMNWLANAIIGERV
jgi:hypothetical protein